MSLVFLLAVLGLSEGKAGSFDCQSASVLKSLAIRNKDFFSIGVVEVIGREC